MDRDDELRSRVEKQARRMQQAERDRPTLLAQSVYLGTLALMFVLPVIAGAYLGNWLDNSASGYSIGWTITLIVIGVLVGALNVYLFVQERG